MYFRVSMKALLVMLKLLPPIYLFHLVQSFRFFLDKFSDIFFTLGNFFTVRDPLMLTQRKKLQPSTKHFSLKNQEKLPEIVIFDYF